MPYGEYNSLTPALSGLSARTFGTGSYSDSSWTVFNASDYTGALILLEDGQSGRIGTVRHEFEVPQLSAFRTSTPVLTDTFRPDSATPEASLLPVPLARRRFTSGAKLACLFDVYGAARDPRTGMPKVFLGYEVGRAGSVAVPASAQRLITPGAAGHVSQRIDVSLRGAEPGEYELVLLVEDEVSREILELREPFVVEAADPAGHPPAGAQPGNDPPMP